MANVLDRIHKDHVHMARLLDLIDLETTKARNNDMPDFLMLEHVMRYMTNYLDQMHHNVEDAIFRRVSERDSKIEAVVDELMREHDTLKVVGERLYDVICAAQNSDFVRRDDFISLGTEYTQILRAHMGREEEDILKRARRVLTKKDYSQIEAEIDAIHDPLFGDVVESEYQQLYAYIMAQQESLNEASK